MHREVAAVDPEYAARIHVTDPVRIVRALEVYAVSGEPLSAHHRRHADQHAHCERGQIKPGDTLIEATSGSDNPLSNSLDVAS